MKKYFETSGSDIPGRGHIGITTDGNLMTLTFTGPFLAGHDLGMADMIEAINESNNQKKSKLRQAFIFEFMESAVIELDRLDLVSRNLLALRDSARVKPSFAIVMNPELDGCKETATMIAGLVARAKYDVRIVGNLIEAVTWSRQQMVSLPFRHFSEAA